MDVTIEQAKSIRKELKATHLIMFTADSEGGQNVATHGESEQQAHEACQYGNKLKKLLGWPEELYQSTPTQRAEWRRKSAVEIKADISRLLDNKRRNELGRQALLEKMGALRTSEERWQELNDEWLGMKRRAEDYDVRIQALEWVLDVSRGQEGGQDNG
ncbi:hypothetical protein [Hymenobacter sp. PAMC 26628]|uniref:hypothetical protein n=1 Tax=Hymenobacter sp. PAMC 26628 TaxID=1484118 RepID=UPI00077059BC|nr:hypothetical protein [Hymenobacter sp. PAMC 26628]AMJ65020.1 hypothetical protein AXW84_05965 [Hymenobacter sp. PAMC 26628]